MVSSLALGHAAPNPPESPTCLELSTKHDRESKRGKKSILSLRSKRPLSAASHQAAETLAGVRAGSGPPAQPSWEPGKAVVLLWQRASPSSERQDSQKKKHFTFPLGKSFCNISLVAWKSLAGSEGEIRGCTGWSHIKHHNSFGTSSLHLPHSSRTCGVQVSFPTVFCKTQSQGKRVPSLCHSTSSTWQPPGSPGCFCTHTPSLSWPGGF